jgi:thioredoxin 1
MIEINTKEFRNLVFDINSNKPSLKSSKPVILDFYAEWCMPCKAISKTLNELSLEFDEFEFYKINSEESYELTEYFKIKNLPTLILIPTEGEIKVLNGNVPKSKLIEAFNNTFNKISI